MVKKLITLMMSVMLALSAVIMGMGCGRAKEFTVTFDGNAADAELYYGEKVQIVKSADDIKAPIFVRDGYNFTGWDCSVSNIKKDKIVKALWKAYTFTVTFNGNGGVNENGERIVSIYANSAKSLINSAPKFVKDGYNLSWDINLSTITKTCVVNAIWTPDTYTISFRNHDKSDMAIEDINILFGSRLTELPIPENTETQKFNGWFDENDNSVDKNIIYDYPENKTFYAKWTDISNFVIRYDLDGGVHGTNITFYTPETIDIGISDPNKTGYKFLGWTINGQSDLIQSDDITVELLGGDAELVANWKANQYSAMFDADGGTLIMDEGESDIKVVTYDQEVGKLPTAEKEGYIFVGWIYGENLIVDRTIWKYDESITLTAFFRKIFTVKFSLKTTVRDSNVDCKIESYGDVKANSIKEFEECSITVIEGQNLADVNFKIFPVVKPVDPPGGNNEYSFNGKWKYMSKSGKPAEITVDTIFDEDDFSAYPDGIITFEPWCVSNWTPNY